MERVKIKEHTKYQIYRYFLSLFPRSRALYKLCQIYIRHYFGFNYGVDLNDGELWFANQVLRTQARPMVFDVGANIGQWTSGVLELCPHADIHVFEPSPKAFATLRARVSAPNVHLNNLAVGKEAARALFYDYDGHETSTFHPPAERKGNWLP